MRPEPDAYDLGWDEEGYAYIVGIQFKSDGFDSQALADELAHIAQQYVGHWHGTPVRGHQSSAVVEWEDGAPWTEPPDESDDCEFCKQLTPENIDRRIRGFQHAMDIEVMGNCGNALHQYLMDMGGGYYGDEAQQVRRVTNSPRSQTEEQWAAYHELVIMLNQKYPEGCDCIAYDFTTLPYYLQYRLCAQWGHALARAIDADPLASYNFEKHEVEYDDEAS